MQNRLFFLCPSDHLEPVIDRVYGDKKYYLTSLGNSIEFTKKMISEVEDLLQSSQVNHITFVLSKTNTIAADALAQKEFSEECGLMCFQEKICRCERTAKRLWQKDDYHFLILSYYLNAKIRELKFGLKHWYNHQPKVNGKIYYKEDGAFYDIHHDLTCREFPFMN